MEENKVVATAKEKQAIAKVVDDENNSPVYSDPEILGYLNQLYNLRKEGKLKIANLEEEIYDVKHNQMLDSKTKETILNSDKVALEKAREVAKKNSAEEKQIVAKAVTRTKAVSTVYQASVKQIGKDAVASAQPGHEKKLVEIQDAHQKALAAIHAEHDSKIAVAQGDEQKKLKNQLNAELSSENISYNSNMKEEKANFTNIKKKAKNDYYTAFLAKFHKLNEIHGGKNTWIENEENKIQKYIANFDSKTFFLTNALYFVVIAFFIACIIISPITGNGLLLTGESLITLATNMSQRLFFALGVAGLILLGGTDLSIGRLIGLGTLCTGLLLQDKINSAAVFKSRWDLSGISFGVRVPLAIIVTVFATTLVSSIAGFFSAKFKMHPFITTLSTMLITYGFMMVATSGNPTGPVSSTVSDVVIQKIGGWLPTYVIYAAIAYIVVWFIWNKTKFGKNMYAVGGNPEAAAVSGISYFKVTLGVFIMAGVLYGFGSFFMGMISNPAANNGYGYELDAIASCVIGGISFFGGIGKVSGTILGVLIFEGMTLCLTMLNVSSYWQFVIKGVILMAAVALDSLKYLKKK